MHCDQCFWCFNSNRKIEILRILIRKYKNIYLLTYALLGWSLSLCPGFHVVLIYLVTCDTWVSIESWLWWLITNSYVNSRGPSGRLLNANQVPGIWVNGSQLAKMKKWIPYMSLLWNLQGKSSWSKKFYITHKNIPVILLVNTTSRDIKYYAYIPNIWREGKKVLYKMDISLILRDIVDILPISPMPTLMWLPWRLLVLFSPTVTKTFDTNGIKLRI